MRLMNTFAVLVTFVNHLGCSALAPLSYAPTPEAIYTISKLNTPTLLDVIKTRPELSTLVKTLAEPAGMSSVAKMVFHS